MSEKPFGTLALALGAVGACALCALGPAFFASVVAGASSWLLGLSPMLAIALGFLAALGLYRLWRAWGRRDPARVRHEAAHE